MSIGLQCTEPWKLMIFKFYFSTEGLKLHLMMGENNKEISSQKENFRKNGLNLIVEPGRGCHFCFSHNNYL